MEQQNSAYGASPHAPRLSLRRRRCPAAHRGRNRSVRSTRHALHANVDQSVCRNHWPANPPRRLQESRRTRGCHRDLVRRAQRQTEALQTEALQTEALQTEALGRTTICYVNRQLRATVAAKILSPGE
jgi:hypothetical protein